jgi:hypothetical protein
VPERVEEIQKIIHLQEAYAQKFVKELQNLIDTYYQVTPDKQNQRNLVDLEQDVGNKSRTVRFSILLILFVTKSSTHYLSVIYDLLP